MKKEINLMLGTDYRGEGGICSVINNYHKNLLLNKINSKLIITHCPQKGKLFLIFIFIKAVIKFFYYLIFYKIKIIHIHASSNFSFFRKSIFVLISHIFSIKIFIHIHSGKFIIFYSKSNFLIKWFILTIFKKTQKIIVLNSKFFNFFKDLKFNKKTFIIPNSLEFRKKK